MLRRRALVLSVLLGLLVSSAGVPGVEAGTTSGPRRALSRLAQDSTRPLVARADPGEALPSFVTGRIPAAEFSSAGGPTARGWEFWGAYGRAFGVADPRAELSLRSVEHDDLGMTHLTYDQRYRGLPVFGRQMMVHFAGNAVTVVNGEFADGIEVSTTPAVSATEARVAAQGVPARALRPADVAPELLVFVDGADQVRLAWRVSVVSKRPLGLWQVFVDARSGEVLRFYNDLHTAKNRQTYDDGNDPDCNTQIAPQCDLPGTLDRAEGAPATGDAVVDTAHDHTGTVYDYFLDSHGRDSYDGSGHHMRSTVHFGGTGMNGYNNAFWCPTVGCAEFFGSTPDGEQMVYGDGDGVVFSPLGSDIDVVAHELTHAVTENEANLIYLDQSGALNESYSDVFAAMVDTDNWLIGEDSFTPGTPGDALRDMADPSNGGQPGHMSEFVETIGDSGGVHINSGIPNHAAYLTSEDPGYGIGRAATEDIYYRALTTYLTPTSDFLDNLNALLRSADDLFPGTAEITAVARANAAVGIANPPAVTFPNGGESIPAGSGTTITWTTDDIARPFEVSYLQDMGSATYSQGFEASASLPPEFTTGGNQPWLVAGTTAATGTRSARSGTITHNQRSELTLTARLTSPGNVTFNARVSSEEDFDFFSFHVDGEPRVLESGETPWVAAPPVPVSAGTHTFTFVYEKDFIVNEGSDRAWIDDLVIPNAESVALTTINASTAPGATSEPWTTPSIDASNFKVRVKTLGVAPWYSTDDSNGTFTVGPPPPGGGAALSIGNSKRKEPDKGKKKMKFRVSLSEAGASPVTVGFATKNGSAKAPKDFKAVKGMLTFAPGTTVRVIKVPVKGDLRDERNEKFSVLLSGPSGASIADGKGTGKILDND
jgi:Zn-dependent metalloprotease